MGESDFIREVIRDPRHPEKPPEPTITGYKLNVNMINHLQKKSLGSCTLRLITIL